MILLLAFSALQLGPAGQGEGGAAVFSETVERVELATATAKELEALLGLVALEPPVASPTGPTLAVIGSSAPGAFELEVTNTGTGFAEQFLLQLPPHPSLGSPSPLLVVFHKYGSGAEDVALHTDFEAECWSRNWFLVAPLGASDKSFSSLPSQANTELVLELVLRRLGGYIDRSRLYAAGFSMGGLNAMNYAARHLDPTRPMFAAIVNHTGPGSWAHMYPHQPGVQAIMEFWFGGTPSEFPFEYARSSIIDAYEVGTFPSSGGGLGGGGQPGGDGGLGGPLPPAVDLAVRPENSLAQNLTHVPLYFVRGKFDPSTEIAMEMDAAKLFFEGIGGHVDSVIVPGVFTHLWKTLDEVAALDWLAQFRLALPTGQTTLADRNDRYFHFYVQQDSQGAFTPFTWEVDASANELRVVETANLSRLSVSLADAHLDASRELRATLGTADGAPDEIRLLGVAKAPRGVLRDGVPSSAFTWNARTRVLALFESELGTHEWRILPGR